jgi:hypothetical protein
MDDDQHYPISIDGRANAGRSRLARIGLSPQLVPAIARLDVPDENTLVIETALTDRIVITAEVRRPGDRAQAAIKIEDLDRSSGGTAVVAEALTLGSTPAAMPDPAVIVVVLEATSAWLDQRMQQSDPLHRLVAWASDGGLPPPPRLPHHRGRSPQPREASRSRPPVGGVSQSAARAARRLAGCRHPACDDDRVRVRVVPGRALTPG